VPLNKLFSITASHPDFANALPRPITLTQPEMRNRLVYLRKGGQISGLVTNSSGQPIPNLTIRARADNVEARSTVSDENGRYILGNLANGRYSLEASHNNASAVVDDVLILGDYSVREVDLTLTHQRQLVVTVQNPNGTPVPGVLVDLEYSLAPLARTNDAGKVSFTGLPESELFMLVEAGANHQARIISINESAQSRLITVHPFGSVGGVVGGVSGVLRRAAGGPAAGIVVTLQGTLFPAESVETDASGSYQFANLSDGDYTLSIGNGFNDAIQRSFTIDAESLSPTLDITISYTEIPIRLVDREGVPVAEGLIYLMLNGVNTAFGETDSAGRVTLRAFETGSYSLFATAQGEGWQRRSLHVLLNQTFSEQLLILDDASVSITVTGNGQPVTDALIALIDGADGSLHVTDGAGVVTIKSLPAGNYTLVVSAEGYAPQDGNFSHGATAGTVPVSLSATRSDQPMVQASFLPESVMDPAVMALSAGAADASLRKGRTSSSRPVRNGFQSSFRLPPLPANATEACKEARRALIKADNLAEQAFLNWEQSHWTKKELKNIDSAIVLVQGTKVAADVASLLRAGPTNAAQAQLKQLQSTQSGANLVKANEVLGHLSNLNDLRSSLSDLVNGGGSKDAVFTALNIMKAEAAAISSILSSDPAMAAKFGAAGQVISTVQDIVDLVDNVQIGLNNAKILNDQIGESENQYRQAVDNLSKVSTEWELMNLGGDASDCVNGGSEPEDPPEDEQDPTDQDETERRVSMDPNDILGPRGYGPERWIPNDTLMLYTIRYENVVTATAPAQLVTIEHVVSEYLDYSTFAFDEFGFGDHIFTVPAGRQFFQSRLDLVSELGYIIEYTARFDRATGVARWQLAALDPETGDLSSDPEAGFLPPNANSPEGEGYVRFFIRPKADRATGTQIDAQARIVFDTNEHIDTPVYRNTIDSTPPASAVQSLSAISPPQVIVHWGGDDGGGSGIAFYDIYRSTNGGPWEHWLRTSDTSAGFSGELDSVYAFYSVATDNVGYREVKIPAAETSTTIAVQSEQYLYLPLISRGEYRHLYLPLISQGQ
jgi:hypothetical protein